MYIVRTLNLPDIVSFLDKYKSKTPFIKSYELNETNTELKITLQNDAIMGFATYNPKAYVQWPTGGNKGTQNDTYYVLAFQDKFIFQNAGAFIYGSDIISGIKNTYFIYNAYCYKCNSQTDLDQNASTYQMISVILPTDDVFNGQANTTIINNDIYVQSTTIKLESLSCISQAFYNNMVDYSESAIMTSTGVDLYYLFKLPKVSGYVDGFQRDYAIIDENGYQN